MRTDPRLTPAREGLAAASLEGLVPAGRYVRPQRMQVVVPATAVRSSPQAEAEQWDQLLLGERFDVLETRGAFAWGQAVRDGYVGHVALDALVPEGPAPTHRVRVRLTYGFRSPSIKSEPVGPISLNSLVAVSGREGKLALCDAGVWLPEAHLAPIGVFEADPAAVAESHLGAAYLWGGREGCGLDCSGLVQQALLACGRACPRDSDLQQALGAAASPDGLRRGDLVFWKGHVAMMVDAERMVHANAHHMAVAIEPLSEAIQRISGAGGGEPTAYRRPLDRQRPEAA
ncbi:NlpC/P60 family protein [Phenylobacterium sp.]|uniref:C40 family peptidase n=1 Tax=Phenylobacterium sp. TaxID=1871053 RepID=UPI0037C73393